MATSRSNKVKISNRSIISIEYIDNSLNITNGQPSTIPPSISQSGKDWTIEIKCGRKGSDGVASSFVSSCGGQGHLYSPGTFIDDKPGKLNFSFAVQVGFLIAGNNYYVELHLAQGHSGASNNWWIGGPCVAKSSSAILNIASIAGGDLIETYSITGGTSDFTLSPWIQTASNKEYPDWLKDVDDQELIGNINLPGTHDSAAINRYLTTPYACHSNTLSEQLRNGIRLLDIRLSVHEKSGQFSFITCHGDIGIWGSNEFQTLSSALDECSSFLSANDSEFMAMTLKVDDWNGITNKQGAYTALESLINGFPNTKSSSMPKLVDVRGKIFFMNRITNDLQFGVPIDWSDNTPGSNAYSNTQRSYELYVQDQYNGLGGVTDSATRIKLELFTAAIPVTTPGQMLLNYASAVQVGLLGVYIMPSLLQYFGNNQSSDRPARLGWSLFDYVSTTYPTNEYGQMNVIDMIISSNFSYKGYEKPFTVYENKGL